jgi:hypothetical protein
MTGKSGDLAQRKANRVADAEPFLGLWDAELVAPVVSALSPAAVSADQLRRRAVALGLLREPPSGGRAELTAREVSRLFLAGYRLPAQVEQGDAGSVRRHLGAGRQVFVLLDERELDHRSDPDRPRRLYRLLDFPRDAIPLAEVRLGVPGGGETENFRLPASVFTHSWATAGNLLVVAAPDWHELADDGSRFFAGSRSRDGTYHWDTAECDTTADGEVLR